MDCKFTTTHRTFRVSMFVLRFYGPFGQYVNQGRVLCERATPSSEHEAICIIIIILIVWKWLWPKTLYNRKLGDGRGVDRSYKRDIALCVCVWVSVGKLNVIYQAVSEALTLCQVYIRILNVTFEIKIFSIYSNGIAHFCILT